MIGQPSLSHDIVEAKHMEQVEHMRHGCYNGAMSLQETEMYVLLLSTTVTSTKRRFCFEAILYNATCICSELAVDQRDRRFWLMGRRKSTFLNMFWKSELVSTPNRCLSIWGQLLKKKRKEIIRGHALLIAAEWFVRETWQMLIEGHQLCSFPELDGIFRLISNRKYIETQSERLLILSCNAASAEIKTTFCVIV